MRAETIARLRECARDGVMLSLYPDEAKDLLAAIDDLRYAGEAVQRAYRQRCLPLDVPDTLTCHHAAVVDTDPPRCARCGVERP